MEGIVIAQKGRVAMLKAIFGSAEEAPAPQKPLNPQTFKEMFGK